MSYQKSFVEVGNKHWGEFKKNINESETIIDTKNIFSRSIATILNEIDPDLNVNYDDFQLSENSFTVSSKVAENEIYKGLVLISDIPSIINRYTEVASHRVTHQSKSSKEQNVKKIQI